MRTMAKKLMVWSISLVVALGFTLISFPSQKAEAAEVSTTTIRNETLALVGKPYKDGGYLPSTGFDNPGLIYYVYKSNGINAPKTIKEQAIVGSRVAAYDWKYGDVLFFSYDGSNPHFAGIYVGSGKFVSVPQNGGEVKVYSLSSDYFKTKYLGAKRYLGSSSSTSSSSTTSSSIADKIVSLGDNYLGTPYVYGAKSYQTNTFDCSSYTQYVYYKNGVKLPRTSIDQSKVGTYVPYGQWQKGDLLFYSTSYSNGKIAHVAIYAGDGKILHTYGSPGVTFTSVSNSWWKAHYKTARRVIN